jgi:CheY-like chemotaxis protein
MTFEEAAISEASLPRVLVIDDDPVVGRAIQRVLHGFHVTFAQSATGALGRILGGAEFRAVICDVMMPGVTGLQFHGQLVRDAPELARRTVFVSGACSAELEAYVRREQVRWVQKPFTRTELRAAVDAACRTA